MNPINQGQRIEGLVLDIDGFVLDTMPTLLRTFREAVKRATGVEVSDDYMHSLSGLNGPGLRAKLTSDHGSEFPFDAIRREQDRLAWASWESSGIACKPGIDDLIAIAQEFQVPLAAGSGNPRDVTERKLEVAGIKNSFAIVVGGDEVAHGKPDPETFLLARTRLIDANLVPRTASPSQFLVGGDAGADIEAAITAGMPSLYVPEIGQLRQGIAELASYVFQSLKEATRTIRSILSRGRIQ